MREYFTSDTFQTKNNLPREFSRVSRLDDNERLFDLSSQVIDDNSLDAFLRMDRLSLGYSEGALVAKLGRQAISWGNGLLFNTLDLFNPFSPSEIDKDYKAGDDMAYGQWLFDSGADLQVLIVPRRDPESGSVTHQRTSYASKFHSRIEALEIDYDILLSEHFDEVIFGLGLSGPIGEGIWRSDFALVNLADDSSRLSALVNTDRS